MPKIRQGLNGREAILLIDDDVYFRFAIATELRAAGYLVVCAENGERGIRMIEDSERPITSINMVITDLVMPRKNGLHFCNELRTIDDEMPVLVITGFLSPEVEKKFRKIGCIDFLEKPFSPEELVRKVKELLLKEVC